MIDIIFTNSKFKNFKISIIPEFINLNHCVGIFSYPALELRTISGVFQMNIAPSLPTVTIHF